MTKLKKVTKKENVFKECESCGAIYTGYKKCPCCEELNKWSRKREEF